MPRGASQRRHHLDAIRVSAILLLIPYHAARYVQKGDGGAEIVDAVVWFVHTWHMPLFFAISGFLAASALRRSTAVGQLRARFRRLGLPLAVGMLTVVPLANFLVIGAAALWPRKGALPPKRELDIANVFSLSPRHLWFIAYLLMISVIAIGVWLAIQRAPELGAAINRGFRNSAQVMVGRSGPGVDQRGDPDHQDRLGGGRNRIQLAGPRPDPLRVLQPFLLLRLAAQRSGRPAGGPQAWGLAAAWGGGADRRARLPALLRQRRLHRQCRHAGHPGRNRRAAPLRVVHRRPGLLAHPVRNLGGAGTTYPQGVARAALSRRTQASGSTSSISRSSSLCRAPSPRPTWQSPSAGDLP